MSYLVFSKLTGVVAWLDLTPSLRGYASYLRGNRVFVMLNKFCASLAKYPEINSG
ncbi:MULTISPECIES: hypothetical protein [unclassified Rickettsia]|uniref:hypothetical protein n=1 Tax=unclassified Rickettsia TaxID=114295 RepID=UPI003132B052